MILEEYEKQLKESNMVTQHFDTEEAIGSFLLQETFPTLSNQFWANYNCLMILGFFILITKPQLNNKFTN